jgi:hypothetical protein
MKSGSTINGTFRIATAWSTFIQNPFPRPIRIRIEPDKGAFMKVGGDHRDGLRPLCCKVGYT